MNSIIAGIFSSIVHLVNMLVTIYVPIEMALALLSIGLSHNILVVVPTFFLGLTFHAYKILALGVIWYYCIKPKFHMLAPIWMITMLGFNESQFQVAFLLAYHPSIDLHYIMQACLFASAFILGGLVMRKHLTQKHIRLVVIGLALWIGTNVFALQWGFPNLYSPVWQNNILEALHELLGLLGITAMFYYAFNALEAQVRMRKLTKQQKQLIEMVAENI